MKKQKTFRFLTRRVKSKARNTIGFRLEDEKYMELARRAQALGVSPHELARHYVSEVLFENDERSAVRESLNTVGNYLIEIRKDIAIGTEALLTSAGTLEEKEARNWRERNLYHE